MHIASLLLVVTVLFASQLEAGALPQRQDKRLATTKGRFTTKTPATTKVATTAKTTEVAKPTTTSTPDVRPTKATSAKPSTTARATSVSQSIASHPAASSLPVKSNSASVVSNSLPSISSKSTALSGTANSSATSDRLTGSSAAFSSASSVSSNSVLLSAASVALSSSSAFPSGSSIPVWRVIPSGSFDSSIPAPTLVVEPSSQPGESAVPLFPSGDVSLSEVSTSDAPTATSDVAALLASAPTFKIRGVNNLFESLEGRDGAEEHDVSDSPIRRAVYTLYHGTCYSSLASIQQGLRLPNPRADEFSYKSGFYLTDSAYNAFAYVRLFKRCPPGDRKIVITFRYVSDGLSKLQLGQGRTAMNFWTSQFRLSEHNARGTNPRPAWCDEYQQMVDNADVITGSVPLQPTQIFDQGPRDPFGQVVIVSQRGLNALELVDWAYA